jgi:hypothetical protein
MSDQSRKTLDRSNRPFHTHIAKHHTLFILVILTYKQAEFDNTSYIKPTHYFSYSSLPFLVPRERRLYRPETGNAILPRERDAPALDVAHLGEPAVHVGAVRAHDRRLALERVEFL